MANSLCMNTFVIKQEEPCEARVLPMVSLNREGKSKSTELNFPHVTRLNVTIRQATMKLQLSFFLIIFSIQSFSQDTIVINIAHGSKPRRQFNDEYRTIGGLKGGHVVIQIDQYAYGFYFTGNRIHVFPHGKSRNGVFQKQTEQEWINITKDKKVTKFFIPLTKEKKLELLAFYNQNLQAPSYDYAFFGQRCASSAYTTLKRINIMTGGSYIFNAFYPGQLRKKLLKQSRKKIIAYQLRTAQRNVFGKENEETTATTTQ